MNLIMSALKKIIKKKSTVEVLYLFSNGGAIDFAAQP